jgi:hypothetical protein
VTLVDRRPAPADLAADERVSAVRGEVGEVLAAAGTGQDALAGASVTFHLAGGGQAAARMSEGRRAVIASLTGSGPGRAVMTRTMASSSPALSRAKAAGAAAAGP